METNAGYMDDLALFANTPTQAKFCCMARNKAAKDIGFFVNWNKTESMYFK